MKRLLCCSLLLAALPCGQALAAAEGVLDPSFGEATSGKLLIPFELGPDGDEFAGGMAVDGSGRVYMAGGISLGANNLCLALARATADGEIDETFGPSETGHVCHSEPAMGMIASDAAMQSNGKLVTAGIATDADFNFSLLVCRFSENGEPDASFGLPETPGCHALVLPEGYSEGEGNTVAIQADGLIVVGGRVFDDNAGFYRAVVVRLNTFGQRDDAFGENGVKILLPEHDFDGSVVSDITQSPDGSLVAVGRVDFADSDDTDLLVVRLKKSNGDRDTTFSGDGKFQFDFGVVGGRNTLASAVQVLADNSIVVAGQTLVAAKPQTRAVLVKLLPDGQFDPTFNPGPKPGRRVYQTCDPECTVTTNDLLIMPDGKIVMGGVIGFEQDLGSTRDLFALRVSGDGAPDTAFGPYNGPLQGVALVDFANNEDFYPRIARQGKKILLSGTAMSGSNYDFALARLGDGSLLSDSFEDAE